MESGGPALLTVCIHYFSGDFHLASESQSYLIEYMPGYFLILKKAEEEINKNTLCCIPNIS